MRMSATSALGAAACGEAQHSGVRRVPRHPLAHPFSQALADGVPRFVGHAHISVTEWGGPCAQLRHQRRARLGLQGHTACAGSCDAPQQRVRYHTYAPWPQRTCAAHGCRSPHPPLAPALARPAPRLRRPRAPTAALVPAAAARAARAVLAVSASPVVVCSVQCAVCSIAQHRLLGNGRRDAAAPPRSGNVKRCACTCSSALRAGNCRR